MKNEKESAVKEAVKAVVAEGEAAKVVVSDKETSAQIQKQLDSIKVEINGLVATAQKNEQVRQQIDQDSRSIELKINQLVGAYEAMAKLIGVKTLSQEAQEQQKQRNEDAKKASPK